jgi:hypothetical protein
MSVRVNTATPAAPASSNTVNRLSVRHSLSLFMELTPVQSISSGIFGAGNARCIVELRTNRPAEDVQDGFRHRVTAGCPLMICPKSSARNPISLPSDRNQDFEGSENAFPMKQHAIQSSEGARGRIWMVPGPARGGIRNWTTDSLTISPKFCRMRPDPVATSSSSWRALLPPQLSVSQRKTERSLRVTMIEGTATSEGGARTGSAVARKTLSAI